MKRKEGIKTKTERDRKIESERQTEKDREGKMASGRDNHNFIALCAAYTYMHAGHNQFAFISFLLHCYHLYKLV